ncbi:hypothetical protein C0J52_01724 [Blattella germanica]|nr:hypothetical protein C0J52_01724 [Blattella germanica]
MDKSVAYLAFTLLFLSCVLQASSIGDRAGNCPVKSYVPTPINKCTSDFQCLPGQKCCPNLKGYNACVKANAVG